jgi:hypothetical protein
MTDELVSTEAVNKIIAQGRALVQAIAAMDTSAPGDPIERRRTRLLQVEYRHRLRELLRAVPAWVAEEILNSSGQIEDEGAVGQQDGETNLSRIEF